MSYPPQGFAGVSDFLSLTDVVDTTYVGQAQKVPLVNVAETALELGYAQSAPLPVFPETVLYNAMKGIAWEDLDVGVGSCFAFIQMECVNNRGAYFRQRAETKDTDGTYGTQSAANAGGGNIGYAWVPTDADGFVEWRMNIADNVILRLMGYISMPTLCNELMYDGIGNIAWTHLDPNTGGGYHVCFIRAWNKNTSAAMANPWLRPGYSAPLWVYGTGQPGNIAIDGFKYGWIPTNWNGQIDMKDTAGGLKEITIHNIGFISNLRRVESDVFRGVTTTAWQTLDLPVGKAFVLLRIDADALQAATNMRFRMGGEATDVGDRGGPHTIFATTFNTDRWAYIWMITNGYGQVEFITTVAVDINIELVGYL